VAAVTGIDAAAITSLADAFGRARGASIHMSTGVNMGRHGTLAYWLLHMVAFVTGNLDHPGGNVLSVGYYTRRARAGRVTPDSLIGIETPFGRMPRPHPPVFPLPGNLLPDLLVDPENPIRALIVCAGNPVLSLGGEQRLRAALPRLELLVVIDLYRNATGEYAHYLLPATDAFEREDINALGAGMQAHPNIQYTRAVVAPRAERRHERAIIGDIAAAMGLAAPDSRAGADPWSKTDHMLKSRGLGFAALKAAEVLTFGAHEMGRFFSDYLQTEDQRVDCFPTCFAPALAALAADFAARAAEPPGRLRLISRRDARMMNSWYSNLPRLRTRTNRDNPLYMHPRDAAARGLTDGATARVWNAHGAITATVCIGDDLMPGAVAMSHGWGHAMTSGMRVAQAAPGVNCNRLLPTGPGSFDALSGQAHMTGVPVEVEAVPG
jgi:anaerobic selenocysteine-containing dehydrogenase